MESVVNSITQVHLVQQAAKLQYDALVYLWYTPVSITPVYANSSTHLVLLHKSNQQARIINNIVRIMYHGQWKPTASQAPHLPSAQSQPQPQSQAQPRGLSIIPADTVQIQPQVTHISAPGVYVAPRAHPLVHGVPVQPTSAGNPPPPPRRATGKPKVKTSAAARPVPAVSGKTRPIATGRVLPVLPATPRHGPTAMERSYVACMKFIIGTTVLLLVAVYLMTKFPKQGLLLAILMSVMFLCLLRAI